MPPPKEAGSRAPPGSEEADERFAAALSTCLAELDHNQTAAASVDGRGGRMGAGVVLVGSSEDSLDRIPTHVRRCFTHEVCIGHMRGVWGGGRGGGPSHEQNTLSKISVVISRPCHSQ